MGIHTLPPPTVRAIGAAQALNDPAAVIKELIDNALDARATSIAIEISANTLDFIRLRDNGHGIPPEDRPLVARPYCTSKIRSEEELHAIGATSLGFRGEALASLAEMSGSLTITTRVEGEQVAMALKIDHQGEVVDQQRASLPLGTTVKVTAFLKEHPVRRQLALKNSEKCLIAIKRYLQSYAFARPHVRLSLRVLKSKNNKGDWTYAPKPSENAEDTAYKLVGAACASQCIWSVVENDGFALRAFLPKLEADVNKVSNVGSFVSVDGRPVSAARGTSKQVMKIFRESLKMANPTCAGLKEPFIHLDISCPLESYDANIEPAKEDVLFERPDVVLQLARQLFETVYPAPKNHTLTNDGPDQLPAESRETDLVPEEDDFFTSLELPDNNNRATRPEEAHLNLVSDEIIQELASNDHNVENDLSSSHIQPVFRHNMYGFDEEDLDLFNVPSASGHGGVDLEELRQARGNINIPNPWVFAKMNAYMHRRGDEQYQGPMNPSEAVSTALPSSDRLPNDLGMPYLPTPRPSSPLRLPQRLPVPDCALDLCSESYRAPPAPMALRDEPERLHEIPSPRPSPAYDYTSSSQPVNTPSGMPLQIIPDISAQRAQSSKKQYQQTQLNKPFKPPIVKEVPREKVWFDHLENQTRSQARQGKKGHNWQNNSHDLVVQGELGDLAEDAHSLTPPRHNRDIREFVTRNKFVASVRDQRQRKGVGELGAVRTSAGEENTDPLQYERSQASLPIGDATLKDFLSDRSLEETYRPSKRRKTNEAQVLHELSVNGTTTVEDDSGHDMPETGTRATSRRRRTTDRTKARRRKSSRRPLESVPKGKGTQNLVFNLSLSIRDIVQHVSETDQMRTLLSFHETTVETSKSYQSAFQAEEAKDITQRLYQLLRDRVSGGAILQDLNALVVAAIEG